MQDAQNLQLEQQQVALLRVMEAEMARLRAQHMSAQQVAGVGSGFQHQAHFAPTQEVLHGAASRAMSNGHPNLPQGMVLPEGWTLMPLNRQEGTAPATVPTAVNAQPNVQEASTVGIPAHAQSSSIPPAAPQTSNGATHNTSEPQQTTQAAPPTEPSAGPTDERGSPLFVPTVPTDTEPTQPEIHSPTPTRTQHPENTSTSPSAEPANTPWTSGSWGFNEQIPARPSNGSAAETTAEQQLPETEESGAAYAGKGKGKAVEVEDASDQDA
jgi:E3 ubiquitin-protein ligase synoviolin